MIFVEGKPDLVLVRAITDVPENEVAREFEGKSGVCKRLQKRRNCKGLIDEDPRSIQPRYVRNLKLVEDIYQHELKVLHDTANNNYLIVLCPRLEEWILQAARESNIDVRNYGLPDDGVRLHGKINHSLNEFEELVKDLRHSDRINTLSSFLVREERN